MADRQLVDRPVIVTTCLEDYFRDRLECAFGHQQIDPSAETAAYLLDLLLQFSRSEDLFEFDETGTGLRPLALMLADALEEQSRRVRELSLRRMGDVALFLAGCYPDWCSRRLVNVDYYIGMGRAAYASLVHRHNASAQVFDELAARFRRFVQVVDEVAGSRQSLSFEGVDLNRLIQGSDACN